MHIFRPRTEKTPRPSEPEVLLGVAIENGQVVGAVVRTDTAAPHWTVGNTGSGKSVLHIPLLHVRQHGGLIEILDIKRHPLTGQGDSGSASTR